MKIILAILCVLAPILAKDDCNACLNGECYTKTLIYEPPSYISLVRILDVDYTNKMIYCEFFTSNFRTIIAGVKQNNKIGNFNFVSKLYGLTVDQNTQDVYVASSSGNFKYNPRKASNLTNTLNIKMNHLQFKRDLYFSSKNNIHICIGSTIYETIHTKYDIKEFIVDKNNDIYFRNCNNDAIYKYDSKNYRTSFFCNENFEISLDKDGDVYLYFAKNLMKVIGSDLVSNAGYIEEETAFRPVFDWNNNIIFAQNDKIYAFKPVGGACAVRNGTITRICRKICDGFKCFFSCGL